MGQKWFTTVFLEKKPVELPVTPLRQFYSDIHLWLHTTLSANLHVNTGHLSVYLVVFRLVLEDVDEGEDEDRRHVNRERDEEHEKITVVATTDAVVHPGAVMVKYLENQTKLWVV